MGYLSAASALSQQLVSANLGVDRNGYIQEFQYLLLIWAMMSVNVGEFELYSIGSYTVSSPSSERSSIDIVRTENKQAIHLCNL